MRRKLASSGNDDVEINLSPMIDMVFILLIFFIVTTVFVEETGIKVNKPEADATDNLDNESITIVITAENKVVYEGRNIGLSGVSATVRRLALRDDLPVIIKADQGATHGMFARVYGEVKATGAKSINFF